ncbi:hypothetical protein [Haloferula rosea]|uniref:TPM domain-containing protein n=1 Tax=Haloferula rosea TaxID=490093 RepID=A0A934R607_9BACT|nr:hypothetical protein [Haloferula rosea]MBK1825944.1 hypothetical protein [Haloferula rosea]
MHCPYCRTLLSETSPECPGCRLNLARASALLGPVPIVKNRICDQPRLLDPAAQNRLLRRMDRFERRFPQVRLQVLCRTFPTEHPFSLYLFWIFNLGRISSDLEKGGNNRVILLALDPQSSRSGIMPGYGLEPFLDQNELDELLASIDEIWGRHAWDEGFIKLIDGLDSILEGSIHRLTDIFGHAPRPAETREIGF